MKDQCKKNLLNLMAVHNIANFCAAMGSLIDQDVYITRNAHDVDHLEFIVQYSYSRLCVTGA